MDDAADRRATGMSMEADFATRCRRRSSGMSRPLCLAPLLLCCLGACAHPNPASPAALPGSDRDAHGCIPSAGYSWCSTTNQCERPWELARTHGFEQSAPAFDRFCGNPARQGTTAKD